MGASLRNGRKFKMTRFEKTRFVFCDAQKIVSSNLVNYSLWTKTRYFGQLPKAVVQSTTYMDHNNMVYQMELRLSFSQQLAEGLRDGGHHLTDLYVKSKTPVVPLNQWIY